MKLTVDVHPFVNLLVSRGSDEVVNEGEDLEFEEEIGYIKIRYLILIVK